MYNISIKYFLRGVTLQLPVRRSCIPELLERKGKLQVDLAVHLEVSEAFVSQVISLKANFSVLLMRKAARFLNCKMDDLYEWTDE